MSSSILLIVRVLPFSVMRTRPLSSFLRMVFRPLAPVDRPRGLPLWPGYEGKFASKVADINNVNTDGFAGAIVAALFLKRFVAKAASWAHFDIYGWNPVDKPHAPVGGEAQAIRALERLIARRYGS